MMEPLELVLVIIFVSVTRRRRGIKIPSCKSIVSNYHGRTHKCNFSVFDWKFPFSSNLVNKDLKLPV